MPATLVSHTQLQPPAPATFPPRRTTPNQAPASHTASYELAARQIRCPQVRATNRSTPAAAHPTGSAAAPSPRCAPNAMRMPISLVRCVTMYDNTPYNPTAANTNAITANAITSDEVKLASTVDLPIDCSIVNTSDTGRSGIKSLPAPSGSADARLVTSPSDRTPIDVVRPSARVERKVHHRCVLLRQVPRVFANHPDDLEPLRRNAVKVLYQNVFAQSGSSSPRY